MRAGGEGEWSTSKVERERSREWREGRAVAETGGAPEAEAGGEALSFFFRLGLDWCGEKEGETEREGKGESETELKDP